MASPVSVATQRPSRSVLALSDGDIIHVNVHGDIERTTRVVVVRVESSRAQDCRRTCLVSVQRISTIPEEDQ